MDWLGAAFTFFLADPTSYVIKPIVDTILKSTTSLIQEEFSQVHGVKEDIKDLESKLTSIQGLVEDAENKQVNVRIWKIGSESSRSFLFIYLFFPSTPNTQTHRTWELLISFYFLFFSFNP